MHNKRLLVCSIVAIVSLQLTGCGNTKHKSAEINSTYKNQAKSMNEAINQGYESDMGINTEDNEDDIEDFSENEKKKNKSKDKKTLDEVISEHEDELEKIAEGDNSQKTNKETDEDDIELSEVAEDNTLVVEKCGLKVGFKLGGSEESASILKKGFEIKCKDGNRLHADVDINDVDIIKQNFKDKYVASAIGEYSYSDVIEVDKSTLQATIKCQGEDFKHEVYLKYKRLSEGVYIIMECVDVDIETVNNILSQFVLITG